jgi:hypothetical protein
MDEPPNVLLLEVLRTDRSDFSSQNELSRTCHRIWFATYKWYALLVDINVFDFQLLLVLVLG